MWSYQLKRQWLSARKWPKTSECVVLNVDEIESIRDMSTNHHIEDDIESYALVLMKSGQTHKVDHSALELRSVITKETP